MLPEPRSEVIYWEPNKRTRGERETLNWIFETSTEPEGQKLRVYVDFLRELI
jgi:hypothetical protein